MLNNTRKSRVLDTAAGFLRSRWGLNSGFTIVEMLIVIFIGTLLLLGLFSLYDWHSRMYNYQQGLIRVSESARNSTQAISENTSQAYRVLASQTVNGTLYASGANTLVLQMPSIDAGSNVLPGKWDYIVFYVSGNDLFQVTAKDALSSRVAGTRKLSDVLHSIEFTFNSNDFTLVNRVSVNLQTRTQVRDQLISQQLQQNIYLKNF
jgi:prepilin-type N-terminal cleavage/methylation domain-containing protein